jgi:GGDEF domain-containing protein
MSRLELIIWSMALGAIAAVALARAADLLVRPSRSQLRAVAYHGTVFLLVLILSGVLQQAGVPAGRPLHVAQVLAGPVCGGLANFWVRGWLNAHQRDRIMFQVLRASAWAVPLAGAACLALPLEQQLLAAAGISLLGSTTTLWLTVRAWVMGDRLAAAMAAANLLSLLSLAGLYALSLSPGAVGMVWQAVAAGCVAIGNGIAGYVLWRRERHEWKTRQADGRLAQFDPVTRLHSGVALVRKLIHAQRRRRRTRRDGAVLAIMVFDLDKVAAQAGSAGVNEMLIAIASRIQRQVGVVNPVGRYWERCFVSLVETIHSPAWMRTLGLRVSTSLRRPIEVTGLDGRRIQVRADVGVGVVHLSARQAPVEDILHDAQRMAEAAREMPSRAATMDLLTGEVVPVEEANLGPRRHGHASLVPHAVPPLRAAART